MQLKKSVSKRITITKSGMMIRRPMGVNHFKTSKNSKGRRQKTKTRSLDVSAKRIINY